MSPLPGHRVACETGGQRPAQTGQTLFGRQRGDVGEKARRPQEPRRAQPLFQPGKGQGAARPVGKPEPRDRRKVDGQRHRGPFEREKREADREAQENAAPSSGQGNRSVTCHGSCLA